jgi:hypothetical protein
MSVDMGCHTWAMRPCPRPSAAWLALDDEFVVAPRADEFVVAPWPVDPWPAFPLLGHWLVALGGVDLHADADAWNYGVMGQPMLEAWNERVWCTHDQTARWAVPRRPSGLYPGGVPWPVHFTMFLAALT